ncbi:hypothetical protein T552_03043 [Pneumocystis carinii B80]|uniref:CENP-C homolog n=1 Tax=Pneumocystis carinii (strain B80) TaxID=1408658 RepID=A0A0W4ZCX4_PNEC8|nr:hypothetical protein T552_03043 [Pneumocystis carinii B80]KTW26151.1 hypothetical protein T552_03043 [Pneumocystis carinii B80]
MIWGSGSARIPGSSGCPNAKFMDIGVVGRKTGLRIRDSVQRDSFGMEDMDAFFSPSTPPSVDEAIAPEWEISHKNEETISLEQSMDVSQSLPQNASDIVVTRKMSNSWMERNPLETLAGRRVLKGESPWIGRSPTKTNLNSPALRIPSTQKREPVLLPSRLDWSDGVARKLDFSAGAAIDDDSEEQDKPAPLVVKSVKRGQLMQQKKIQKTFSLMDNLENSESDQQDDAQNFINDEAQDWDNSLKYDIEDKSTEESDNKLNRKYKKDVSIQKKKVDNDVSRKKRKITQAPLKSKKFSSDHFPEKRSLSSRSSTESPDASPKMGMKTKLDKKQSRRVLSEDLLPSVLSPHVNGTRRSLRTKVAPLAYWRNERIVYELGERRKSGPAMPKIKEIIRVDPISIPNKHKGTNRTKNTNYKRKLIKSEMPSDDEWEEKVDVECEVINWHDKKPIVKRIAYPASSYAPRDVTNAIIKFQKTFDEAPFFATGVMDLPRGGEKATKPSKHNVMTFVILEGAVEATVHQTSFRLKRGSHFIVPRGNYYSIRNIANKVSRLFFTQATDTLENEELRA